MSYVDNTLAPGETVLYTAGLHPVVFAPVAGLALGALVCSTVDAAPISGFLFVVGAIASLRIAIEMWTTEYAVTSRRAVAKRGWIGREVHESQIDRIEGVRLEQTAIGRALGYGNVVASGMGEMQVVFSAVADPLSLMAMLQSRIGSHP